MADDLIFRAGRRALPIIRDEGLRPDRIRIIAGAAGGPKWLVLDALDRLLFGRWLKSSGRRVSLVGASIGAWRFAAAARTDPVGCIDRLEAAYIAQRYAPSPSPDDISRECARILSRYLDKRGIGEILSHPYLRVNVLADRGRGPVHGFNRPLQMLHLALAALANAIDRRWLHLFFQRTLFYDPRQQPPIATRGTFPMETVPLTAANTKKALLASGTIPLLMAGVASISGARPGTYWDGGMMDYHLNLPFAAGADDIVLFPHYMDRIIPGWLDKHLPWRKAAPENMDAVLLVAPSAEFVDRLPLKKLPDRTDFYRFKGRDDQRMTYWRTVAETSRQLADAFDAAVSAGTIREKVRPLL